MLAANIISEKVPPLKTTDTCEKAMEWFYEFKTDHLPVVENREYKGLLSEQEILDFNSPEDSLENYVTALQRPSVFEDAHIYEVIGKVTELQLSMMPVLDNDGYYLGTVTQQSLLNYFAETSSIVGQGGIIVIELNSINDYSLAEISRLVEAEGAKILSLFSDYINLTSKVEVTIKLNTTRLKAISATLERFGYQIKAHYQETDSLNLVKDRYDALMNYLNV